jgi:hypothetical protein
MFEHPLIKYSPSKSSDLDAIVDQTNAALLKYQIFPITVDEMIGTASKRIGSQLIYKAQTGVSKQLGDFADETKEPAYLQVPGELLEQVGIAATYIEGIDGIVRRTKAKDKNTAHPPLDTTKISNVTQYFKTLWSADGAIVVYDNGAVEPGRKIDGADRRALRLFRGNAANNFTHILKHFLSSDEITQLVEMRDAPTRRMTGYGLGYILARRGRGRAPWTPINDLVFSKPFSPPYVFMFPQTARRGLSRTMTVMGFGMPGDQLVLSLETAQSDIFKRIPERLMRAPVNEIKGRMVGGRALYLVAHVYCYNWRKKTQKKRFTKVATFCPDENLFGIVANELEGESIDATKHDTTSRIKREVKRMSNHLRSLGVEKMDQ